MSTGSPGRERLLVELLEGPVSSMLGLGVPCWVFKGDLVVFSVGFVRFLKEG